MWNGIKNGFMLVMPVSWVVGVHAFNLLHRPSDFLLLIGVDLLLLLFLLWFILMWTAIQVFRKWWKSRNNDGERIPLLS